jgi:hypothetical protein
MTLAQVDVLARGMAARQARVAKPDTPQGNEPLAEVMARTSRLGVPIRRVVAADG